MAGSKKTDSNPGMIKDITPVKVLEQCFGPGCAPLVLRGVDPEAAHAFYHQIWLATETLQERVGPDSAMKFLVKVLTRLNEQLQAAP
ncbi:MAG: hypothetical protein ACLQDV_11860 [Candidatus Binataceae bacterium]